MKKRVAILIPGLVRSFEKTYQNLFENIIQHNQEDYEFDIFLDIWDSSNSNISEFYRRGVNSERDYRDAISNENIDCSLLKKIYNPTYMEQRNVNGGSSFNCGRLGSVRSCISFYSWFGMGDFQNHTCGHICRER